MICPSRNRLFFVAKKSVIKIFYRINETEGTLILAWSELMFPTYVLGRVKNYFIVCSIV